MTENSVRVDAYIYVRERERARYSKQDTGVLNDGIETKVQTRHIYLEAQVASCGR